MIGFGRMSLVGESVSQSGMGTWNVYGTGSGIGDESESGMNFGYERKKDEFHGSKSNPKPS